MKMRDSSLNRVLMALFLALLFLTFATSCATSTLSEEGTPSSESQPVQESVQPVMAFYYDFKDVPVPKEMEIKRDKSFVFQTTEFTAGLLTFSGRVELDSLMSFFRIKLPEDGWHFLSSIKSPKTVMFFQKESRFCIITITSKTFTTDAEILVAQGFQGI
ncbi:MAG: hypothetical protein JSW12_10850 [Deltaproteobacteria bacterium]|nr:MAG: hypothetical protein JSW12_10850 [Deltaproteobacteria bacterium]